MLWNNVLLHNVAELTDVWRDGKKIQRVPETVRTYLNPGAQGRSLFAANSEMRFVADGPVRIALSSPQGGGVFQVSYGSFMDSGQYPLTGNPLTIELTVNQRLRDMNDKFLANDPWSPHVVRVMFPRQEIVVYKVEGENVRPPRADEMPSLRYLAYGTSITEGGCATNPGLCYAAQTARLLGADLINLGMSGACHAEAQMFDYIASRDDWDIASFALSVNMLGFECDEFRSRVKYGINTVAAAHPDKPIACITLFQHSDDFCAAPDSDSAKKTQAFRQILREEVTASGKANLHLIEGPEILDSVQCLTHDMIHPSDWGMRRMAENLSAKLKAMLP
jgi:lysophospholipase L1-like esterase